MDEWFGVIAKSKETGRTAANMICGRDAVAEMAGSLIESGNEVRVFKCVEVEFDVAVKHTITIND